MAEYAGSHAWVPPIRRTGERSATPSWKLGRYPEAAEAYQKMAAIKVSLFSLNRLAYYRFITGNPDGALAAMRQAVDAGALFPENKAWCLAELGTMYFKLGRLDGAETGLPGRHRGVRQATPGACRVGRRTGRARPLAEAIESYSRAQAIVPLPQYAGALADLYTLQANPPRRAGQNAQIDIIARLEEAAGQKANRTLALVYANQQRDLDRALALAQADLHSATTSTPGTLWPGCCTSPAASPEAQQGLQRSPQNQRPRAHAPLPCRHDRKGGRRSRSRPKAIESALP